MTARGLQVLLVASLLVAATQAQNCYLPNGTLIGGLRVCNPDASASHCCAPGDECTTNGFCKAGNDAANNWLWRGTCTDQTWKSPLCPQYCYNSTTSPSAANIDHLVLACSPDQYCCAYEGETYDPNFFNFDCCRDTNRAFKAGPAEYLAGFAVTTSIFLGFTSISTVPTSAPTSASTTSSVTTTTSTLSTTSLATSSSALMPSSTTTAASSVTGLSPGAQAGVGIGAAVAALAFIALGIFVGLKMKKSRSSGTTNHDEEHSRYGPMMPPPRYEKPAAMEVVEASGQRTPEADSGNVRVELDGNTSYDWRRARPVGK